MIFRVLLHWNMDNEVMSQTGIYIPRIYQYNHNNPTHNKTVCILYGIFCLGNVLQTNKDIYIYISTYLEIIAFYFLWLTSPIHHGHGIVPGKQDMVVFLAVEFRLYGQLRLLWKCNDNSSNWCMINVDRSFFTGIKIEGLHMILVFHWMLSIMPVPSWWLIHPPLIEWKICAFVNYLNGIYRKISYLFVWTRIVNFWCMLCQDRHSIIHVGCKMPCLLMLTAGWHQDDNNIDNLV